MSDFTSLGRLTPSVTDWKSFEFVSLQSVTYIVRFHKTNNEANTWGAYIRLRPWYLAVTDIPFQSEILVGDTVTIWPDDKGVIVDIPFPQYLRERTLGVREIEAKQFFRRFPYGSAPQLSFDIEVLQSNRDLDSNAPVISFDGGIV
jgi:hypothetical protein